MSCNTFYIVTLPSSPCPGEYIGVPCLTLQQYAANPSQSQNIILLIEPEIYYLATVLTVSDGYNFTMSSTNATVTCTSATAKLEFNRVENVYISGITFRGCRNTAIRILQVTNASVVGSSFFDNQVSGSGGCMHIDSSSVTISESVFHNCTCQTYGNGGCMYITSSSITIGNSEFRNNQASYGSGGCLYISSSSVTITESELHNNSGFYTGGGISAHSSTAIIYRSQFSFNAQEYYYGSGGGAIMQHLQTLLSRDLHLLITIKLEGEVMGEPYTVQESYK